MGKLLLNIGGLNADNLIIAIVGMMMVLVAFIILYLIFRLIPVIIEWRIKIKMKKRGEYTGLNQLNFQIPVGVEAAIGAALFLYFSEIHDEENTIMTIKKVSKTYSPWSSKLYSMRWPLK